MFRFSIRELMLVTLVIGLVAGWAVDHLRLQPCCDRAESWRSRSEELAVAMGELGWRVKFGDGYISVVYKDGRPFPWRGDVDWSKVWPTGEPLPAVAQWPPVEDD
jgi:hypothetical protein